MDFLAPLDDLLVLRIDGADARSFLHAQLSNDISGLPSDEARLAAYCTPKGRMLGNLVIWQETSEPDSPLLALVKSDAAEAMLKRLKMFVLRAKVSFGQAPLQVFGLSSANSAASAPSDTASLANSPDALAAVPAPGQAWTVQRQAFGTCIAAPSASSALARWWLVTNADFDSRAWAASQGLVASEADRWQAQDVEAGLGWVEQSNQELFIPQSVNYDLNGGVSFTKGCYPGQEVVARAHFRGTVKRRGVPGFCRLPEDLLLKAGDDIFDALRPSSPAGRIINAVGGKADQGLRPWHLFMEINVGDLEQADFRAESAQGQAIHILPLPYPLEARAND